METSLENILKGCKQYNKLAQRLLFEKYAASMNGICLRYINNPDIAKDVVQEGFIKVFSKIKQYSGKGSFEGWMKRIFINTAISYVRLHSKDKHTVSIEEMQDDLLTEENEYLKPDNDDTNCAEARMVLKTEFTEIELLEVLEKLPEKYRLVVNLYCIEGLKHEEIAKLLDIEASTSRSRLMRARSKIQKELYVVMLRKLNSLVLNSPMNQNCESSKSTTQFDRPPCQNLLFAHAMQTDSFKWKRI